MGQQACLLGDAHSAAVCLGLSRSHSCLPRTFGIWMEMESSQKVQTSPLLQIKTRYSRVYKNQWWIFSTLTLRGEQEPSNSGQKSPLVLLGCYDFGHEFCLINMLESCYGFTCPVCASAGESSCSVELISPFPRVCENCPHWEQGWMRSLQYLSNTFWDMHCQALGAVCSQSSDTIFFLSDEL